MVNKFDLEIKNISVKDNRIKIHPNLPGIPLSLLLLSISEGG